MKRFNLPSKYLKNKVKRSYKYYITRIVRQLNILG